MFRSRGDQFQAQDTIPDKWKFWTLLTVNFTVELLIEIFLKLLIY